MSVRRKGVAPEIDSPTAKVSTVFPSRRIMSVEPLFDTPNTVMEGFSPSRMMGGKTVGAGYGSVTTKRRIADSLLVPFVSRATARTVCSPATSPFFTRKEKSPTPVDDFFVFTTPATTSSMTRKTSLCDFERPTMIGLPVTTTSPSVGRSMVGAGMLGVVNVASASIATVFPVLITS